MHFPWLRGGLEIILELAGHIFSKYQDLHVLASKDRSGGGGIFKIIILHCHLKSVEVWDHGIELL